MSANVTSITFCGVSIPKVKLSSSLPVPQIEIRRNEYYMTPGENGAGIRVIEPLGAHMSYGNLSFRAEGLTATQVSTFLSAVLDYRSYQTLTINNSIVGNATYHVMFEEQGFKPELMDSLLDYDDFNGRSDWGPYAANFSVSILRRTA